MNKLLTCLLLSTLYQFSLAQNISSSDFDYDTNEPFAYWAGEFIIGGTYSHDDQEFGIYSRIFVADNLIFNDDALSIDYSFSYSRPKNQLLGTPAPLIVWALWSYDLSVDAPLADIGFRIIGTIASPFIPEGVTYSHYIFNHFVQANLTVKPLQTLYFNDRNTLRVRPYSSVEGSLDLIVKETFVVTPYYSLGTEWGDPNSHSFIGIKAGFIF